MKRSLLNKWIERLEDPDAKQANELLRDMNGGFCCLGVLCDVIDPNRWEVDLDHDCYQYNGSRDDLPFELANEVGLETGGDVISDDYIDRYEDSLTTMNDNGLPFKEIANILRKYPLMYIKTIEEDL